ncbi:MAG: septal ring lytic transglycosylase RlpA family protein [Granulosicoccus sp.]
MISRISLTALLLVVASVAGCTTLIPEPEWVAAVEGDGPGDPSMINGEPLVVRNLPKSAGGNGPVYTVFDQSYKVLDTAKDFQEWGVATWYGKKFHSRQTASGEIYDMHELTAAHRQLPLPTFVRVTRIDNQRSVVVKVNDRGPFVKDRVIDLSYAAALKLGMVNDGTANVFIEALSTHEGVNEQLAETPDDAGEPLPVVEPIRPSTAKPVPQLADTTQRPPVAATVPIAAPVSVPMLDYVQVGAYSERDNAQNMMVRLSSETRLPVMVDYDQSRVLYRVRIGPFDDDRNMQQVISELAASGISGYIVQAPER